MSVTICLHLNNSKPLTIETWHEFRRSGVSQSERFVTGGDPPMGESVQQACSAFGAANLALLDALWLLLPTGGRRGSASAVRLSARRQPGQRGHGVRFLSQL